MSALQAKRHSSFPSVGAKDRKEDYILPLLRPYISAQWVEGQLPNCICGIWRFFRVLFAACADSRFLTKVDVHIDTIARDVHMAALWCSSGRL